jgi:hypothetical protein
VTVLGHGGEIFDVAQLHFVNWNSTSG